jgi:hypothetical protein
MDHVKIGRTVYFIPSKRHKKFKIGKIIYFQENEIGVKWEKGIVKMDYKDVRLLYENFYIYYDYLNEVDSKERNKIRHLSKLFDDLLIEYFYLFPMNDIISRLIKDIENFSSKSVKELNILWHYLKRELREISFNYFQFKGDFVNPIDRAKNLEKLKNLLTNLK